MDSNVFSHMSPAQTDRMEPVGRALMLRAMEPLDAHSMLCTTPAAEVAAQARREHSRVVVLDAYPCEYADSDGLRWLLALKTALPTQTPLHVVARPGSRVRRNLDLLHADLTLYDTVQDALRPGG